MFGIAVSSLVENTPAAWVTFTNGRKAQLPAEIDGDQVRLIGPNQTYTFHRDDFETIDTSSTPAERWPEVREQAQRGDASAIYQAAWWALKHGLTDEAVGLIRQGHRQFPDHAPLGRLFATGKSLEQPLPARERDLMANPRSGSFQVISGPHVQLFHQMKNDHRAEKRLELHEDVMMTFYLKFAALGFDLEWPEEKLVVVWFAEKSDYQRFIQDDAGNAFLSSQGYYHPTRRIVYTYDGKSRPDYQRAIQGIADRRREVERLKQALADLPSQARVRLNPTGEQPQTVTVSQARSRINQLSRQTDREELLLELHRLRYDLGASVHEMIHQLVMISRLAPRFDAFPVWLHEGLAMQFEVVRGGQWAGFGPVHRFRRDDWNQLKPKPSLESVLNQHQYGPGDRSRYYTAAWALVAYLRREHPREFLAFLDRLRLPGAKPDGPERTKAAFRAAFGNDWQRLENNWHHSVVIYKE